ncbi:hypothetical protein C2S52_009263 [Perilla frutescens var. hirtella]|uniref:Remorin C-terminal domain-containing protein n=1 Tax=Perilla frutescens var. hirtella TaxID=608512 RepID=A0AAD4JQE4_PERFH|nr:hypothetical protein C2S51_017233 [Perilla frutescens var. frutescens]KAH6784304.1 hypothetical protein C2S52_009263 [Perilla frutescens var. hirtella]KAH6838078.1 hypothetical protein C2S53_000020 [Perilla frutescens var. hirtella]
MRRSSGAYTSPGTPEYGDHLPKTWSSERVPLHTSSSRRHVSAAALMPFNSGRAVPSKWDDAERWITSPISGYGAFNTAAAQPHRRPKSKSGPLGPMGLVYLPNYSPTMPIHEGGTVRNFMANSPLTTGVFVPDGLSVHYESGIRSNSLYAEDDGTHISGMPGFSDMLSETSEPSSQDDKLDGGKEEEALVPRRDMATQMSPEGSAHSSTRGRSSFSTLRSSIPGLERLHRNPAGRDDIRDVQVDKGTNTSRGSRKQELEEMDSTNNGDIPTAWAVTESSKDMSRLHREEAKITAWENLQKAKAEAAMRKLEMKLEKKRSASMDKITNKLRGAQTKAQAMRNSLSVSDHPPPTHRKRNYLKIFSICSCLVCTKR